MQVSGAESICIQGVIVVVCTAAFPAGILTMLCGIDGCKVVTAQTMGHFHPHMCRNATASTVRPAEISDPVWAPPTDLAGNRGPVAAAGRSANQPRCRGSVSRPVTALAAATAGDTR